MGVVVGHRPAAVLVLAAGEAGGDARGNPEHPQHQRHRACEVLAVAALALGDEVRQRRRPTCRRRVLVVGEASGRAQPRLDRDDGAVRRPRVGSQPARLLPHRLVRPEREVAVVREEAVDEPVAAGDAEGVDAGAADVEEAVERGRVLGLEPRQLGRAGPRRVAVDRVALPPPEAVVGPHEAVREVEDTAEARCVERDRLRGCDDVGVAERDHLDVLADPGAAVERARGQERVVREPAARRPGRERRRVLEPAVGVELVERRRPPVEPALRAGDPQHRRLASSGTRSRRSVPSQT